MIEVSENFKSAVINGTTSNQLDICVFGYNTDGSNLHIYNSNIVSESMAIEQAISDDSDLKFGGCIASSFEIELSNTPDLTGRYITVWVTQKAKSYLYPSVSTFPGADTFPGYGEYSHQFALFSGEVYSCKLSKNRITRKLVAYDRLYWRGQIDCTGWYRSLYNGVVQMSIYDLRKAICNRFRFIEADESTTLPADSLNVQMITDKVTVSDLLRMICEFNGVFCFFDGGGNLEFRPLSDRTEFYAFYQNAEKEDFVKKPYSGVYFNLSNGGFAWDLNSENKESLYFEQDNILITTGYDDARTLGTHIGDYREALLPNFNVGYTPISLRAETRLWVELGDRIELKIKWYSIETDSTNNEYAVEHEDTVYSYVLSRRIKGIQAMVDEITANGEDVHYTEDSNFDD